MTEKRITPAMIELVPELAEWGDVPIGIEEWIGASGNYALAIGYSRVFWPRIVLFRDYVLLEQSADADAVEPWERELGGNKSAVEAMQNHTHMIDLHTNGSAFNEAQLIELGRTLKEIYQAKLAHAFPNERFEVAFDDTPGQLAEDYQITFWKVRDA